MFLLGGKLWKVNQNSLDRRRGERGTIFSPSSKYSKYYIQTHHKDTLTQIQKYINTVKTIGKSISSLSTFIW